MRKSILLLLSVASLSLLNVSGAFAQISENKNKVADPVSKLGYEKKLRWADNLFNEGSYYNSVDYYGQLIQEQPRNPYLNYQLGKAYSYLRDYPNASKYLGNAYDLASNLYPLAIYEEAVMLKMNGEYDKAEARFRKFIADNPKKYKKEKKRAQLEIDGIVMGRQSMANPQPATVKNLGPNVNTGYTQLSPLPLGDTAILYGTQNITELSVSDRRIPRKDYISKLMVARKQRYTDVIDTFEWPLNFNDGKFNSENFHVGNGVFSKGGDRFYFTRCKEADSNEMLCKIYVSVFEKDRWGEPTELGNNINVDGTSSTNPYIAKVGKKEILFFSSNRKLQGRGGYDLWYSVYDERQKTYRRPQNCGKKVNTVGDEKTPYYDDRTGTLYFASNGWKTIGGFDIYSAKGGPSRYGELQNVGYPVNSTYDDMYYILDPMGKPDGYLVSNRPGTISVKNPTCCDDIWRIQYEPKITIRGVVQDCKTNKIIDKVVVKMVNDEGKVDTFHSEDGKFEFMAYRNHTYVVSADKPSYLTNTRTQISTMGMKREDPDRVQDIVVCIDSLFIDSAFEMKNVYYDFNKATLRPESGAELEKLIRLMSENPTIDVQISAHTDSKGTEDYNTNLSNERANSVVDYLVSSGIDRSRLSTLGMGESQPAAPNTKDGKDNPEGRQRNRRTEFKIIAEHPDRKIIYDSAKKGNLGQQAKHLEINEQDQLDYDGAIPEDAPVEEVEVQEASAQ